MKNIRLAGLVGLLCIFLLVGCGNKAGDNSISSSDNSGDVLQSQEMTTEQLHQYFRQAFDTKGNALDTPEQLALEVAEIKALAADAALPDNYEEQYEEWRTEQIHTMLEKLHSQYDEIIAGLPVGSGAIPGACYAERVDFDGDGLPELFVLSLEQMPNYDGPDAGLGFALELYQSDEDQVLKLGEEHITTGNYESVEICKTGTAFAVHVWHYWGRVDDGADDYYGIKDGKFQALDRLTRSDTDQEAEQCTYTASGTVISMTDYNSIQAKYAAPKAIASFEYTTPSISDRGILPEPSTDVLRRAAMIKVLDSSNAQYARLADMNGDGAEDLIVVVNGEYVPIFRICLWSDAEIQTVDLNQEGYINGLYQEKETGKIYVCYEGGAGPYSWHFYQRASEVIKISDEELSWEEYQTQRSRFELVEDLMDELPKYDTVEAVRQQLMGK